MTRARAVLFGDDRQRTVRYLLLGTVIPTSLFLYYELLLYLTVRQFIWGGWTVPPLAPPALLFFTVAAASIYYQVTDVAIASIATLSFHLMFLFPLRLIHGGLALLVFVLLLAGVSYRNNGVLTCVTIGFVPVLFLLILYSQANNPASNEVWQVWVFLRLLVYSGLGGGSLGLLGYVLGRLAFHLSHSRRNPLIHLRSSN